MPDTRDTDHIYEAFERAWRNGQSPQIESFLAQADSSVREELLRELIQIELWWRRNDSAPPKEADFHPRFPTDRAAVSEAFRRFAERSEAPGHEQSLENTSSQAAVGATVIQPQSAGEDTGGFAPAERRFGRYELLKELGRGGMGAVYLAHDEQLNRKVALKIPTFRDSVRDDMLTRFYREARAAAALRDPGICPVYDVGEIDGQAFIAMAFIEGRPLRDYTKGGKPQDPVRAVRVIRKLAQAMSEAHAAGIVHRDLKPANIMMEKGRRPVIMDFGLAYSTTESEARLTGTGAILGTPTYMSPEQAMGDTERIGPATDIYSLGVIFYEMLAGRVPFEGNVTAVLTQIATADPKPLTEYDLNIDSRLAAIVAQMMAKQPADRFESMEAVVSALTAYLQEGAADGEELEAADAQAGADQPNSQSLQPLSGAPSGTDANANDPGVAQSTRADAGRTQGARTRDRRSRQTRSGRTSRGRASRRTAGKRPSSQTAQPGRPPLLLGGVALGVVLLIGGFFLWRGFVSGAPEANPVAQSEGPNLSDSAGDSSSSQMTVDAPSTSVSEPESTSQPHLADAAGSGTDTQTEPQAKTEVAVRSSSTTTATKPMKIADLSKSADSMPQPAAAPEPPAKDQGLPLVKEFDESTIGQLAPLEVRTAPRPDHLPKYRFRFKPGQPLSDWALVSRPPRVNKVLSWSIEPRNSPGAATWLDVNGDGLIAVGFNDGRVRVYDEEMRLIRIHAELEATVGYHTPSLCFSDDGAWLAACAKGPSVHEAARPDTQEPPGRVVVWDVKSGQRVYEYATRTNHSGVVAWSPDGKTLAICGSPVELHNLEIGTIRQVEKSASNALELAWAPNGDRLALTNRHGGLLQIIDTRSAQVIREIDKGATDPHESASVDWSPDGRWLAFVDGSDHVRIHETGAYTLDRTLPQPDVCGVRFSPDSTQLLCSSVSQVEIPGLEDSAGMVAYDTAAWRPVRAHSAVAGLVAVEWWDHQQAISQRHLAPRLDLGVVTQQFTVSRDGAAIATRSDSYSAESFRGSLIQIRDGASAQLRKSFHVDSPSNASCNLAWQPRGQLIAFLIRRDGTHPDALRLLDSTTGQVAHQLEGHQGKVWQIAWSPDGTQLASAGEDGTCRIWDVATGQETEMLQHEKEQCWLTWSADGKRIACASPFSDLTVWETKTWQQERVFRTVKRTFGKPQRYFFNNCPFSFLKDSESLFLMDDADGFEIANLKTGALVDAGKAVSNGGLSNQFGLSWSPDFTTMLSGGGGSQNLRLAVPGQNSNRLVRAAGSPVWLSDSRRIVFQRLLGSPIIGYDTRTGRQLGALLPDLPDDQWAMIGPDGNFISSPNAAEHLVVTAILEDGRCVTLTLGEFQQQYGWQNNPDQARFLSLK